MIAFKKIIRVIVKVIKVVLFIKSVSDELAEGKQRSTPGGADSAGGAPGSGVSRPGDNRTHS